MSDRQIEISTSSSTAKTIDKAVSEETRSQKKARIASVLARGMVGDRLHVDLPDDVHGEWVPDDPSEIYRKQAMGFEIDTEYAKNRALHSKGDDANRVGDVVFMTCSKENYDIIDEIRRDEFAAMHGAPGQGSKKEEKDFVQQADEPGYVKPIVTSTERNNRDNIREALTSKS